MSDQLMCLNSKEPCAKAWRVIDNLGFGYTHQETKYCDCAPCHAYGQLQEMESVARDAQRRAFLKGAETMTGLGKHLAEDVGLRDAGTALKWAGAQLTWMSENCT